MFAGREASEVGVCEGSLHEALLAHEDHALALNVQVLEVESLGAEVEVQKDGFALGIKALRGDEMCRCSMEESFHPRRW